MSKLDLLAIGEAMAELRPDTIIGQDTGFKVGFSGDTFNTAVYCARALGQGSSVGFFTRVGQDALSAGFINMVEREGLDSSFIALDHERQIGIYSVSTDETGERSFSYWRESSAARQLFSHDEAAHHLPDARISYLSGITLAILSPPARRRLIAHLSSLSKSGETLLAFDSNYRARLWENQATARDVISEMWEICDIAFPSIDDEMELFGEISEDAVIARFAKRDWHACAIKRGVRGPVSPKLLRDSLPEFEPATTVTDTTAAGDSFNGGYLAGLLQGKDEMECLLQGHKIAAQVVGESGAIIKRISHE